MADRDRHRSRLYLPTHPTGACYVVTMVSMARPASAAKGWPFWVARIVMRFVQRETARFAWPARASANWLDQVLRRGRSSPSAPILKQGSLQTLRVPYVRVGGPKPQSKQRLFSRPGDRARPLLDTARDRRRVRTRAILSLVRPHVVAGRRF